MPRRTSLDPAPISDEPMVSVELTLTTKVPLTWFDEENEKGKVISRKKNAEEVLAAFEGSESWEPWAAALHEFNVFSGNYHINWTLDVNDA